MTDGDRIISDVLDDLETAYSAATDASRRFMAAMQDGEPESAALVIPEIQATHSAVLRSLRECRDVVRIQIRENHRRLDSMRPYHVDQGATRNSSAGEIAAIVVMGAGVVAAAVLLVSGFLKG